MPYNPPAIHRSPRPAVLLFWLFTAGFGVYFMLLTPPYQGPDEPNHLFRAYAISTGEWQPQRTGDRRGGPVPEALLEMYATFSGIRWYASHKTQLATVERYVDVAVDHTRQQFMDYPNTAPYPAPVYLPAAAGLWMARQLDLNALATLYAARSAGLIWWMVFGGLALWLLPTARWLWFALMVLPMTVFTHAMVSADTFTNSVAFLCLAFLLRKAYRSPDFDYGDALALGALTVLLATAKLVYTPLLLLALLIPARNFVVYGGKWAVAAGAGGLLLLTLTFWSSRSEHIYLSHADYAEEVRDTVPLPRGVDALAHRAMVIKAPARWFRAARNGLVDGFPMYSRGYIGTFGWLDTFLSTHTILLAYGMLWCLALFDGSPAIEVRISDRLTMFASFLLCYLLVILSQLLSWEPVGSHTVGTIQGRYIIPFAPLLFLLAYRRGTGRYWWIPALALIGSFWLLVVTGNILYSRYYLP